MNQDVFASLSRMRIIPVVEIDDVATGVRLAQTLTEAGLPVMEVTLRTPQALAVIQEISRELPNFLLGAGTLLTSEDIHAAARAGAKFLVSPGRTDSLTLASIENGLPLVPGAVTVSEVMSAVDAGHTHVKFFPAAQFGGAAAIAAMAPPLRASGVRFMPTGGIRPENVMDYLAIDTIFAVGGTWIAPKDLLTNQRFDTISERVTAAISLLRHSDDNHEGS